MRATRDDQMGGRDQSGRHTQQTLIIAIGIIILAAGAWILMPGGDEEPAVSDTAVAPLPQPIEEPIEIAPPVVAVEAVIDEAPDIPVDEPAEDMEEAMGVDAVEEPAPEPEPEPPTPEEIDAAFREVIAGADITPAGPLATAYAAPYLLDRGISSTDQLARGLVPKRTLNIAAPQGAFPVEREGTDYRLDARGYNRYDSLVSAITALPVNAIARVFRDYRDELENAYASLGYPADAMDNTVIAALDQVISAPVQETTPLLTSKGAVWAYANPALEGANDVHKQLLRTGPENTRALQRWAAELREALLNPR